MTQLDRLGFRLALIWLALVAGFLVHLLVW